MKAILNNKKINGIYYKGKKYDGISDNVQILYKNTYKRPIKITTSAGSDYTSGYAVTFSFTTEQFDLINPFTLEKYNYLPNYKFIYYNVTETEINLLTLIYDGDGLFHIEGDLSSLKPYSSGKYGTSIVIALVNENHELFFSSSTNLISASVNSTSVTTNFTTPSNTFETITTTREYIENTNLPIITSDIVVQFTTYYPTYNYSASLSEVQSSSSSCYIL